MIQSTIASAVRKPSEIIEMIRIRRLVKRAWSMRTKRSVRLEVNASGVVGLAGLGSCDEAFSSGKLGARFFFGRSALRRFGRSALRRFGRSALRLFGVPPFVERRSCEGRSFEPVRDVFDASDERPEREIEEFDGSLGSMTFPSRTLISPIISGVDAELSGLHSLSASESWRSGVKLTNQTEVPLQTTA